MMRVRCKNCGHEWETRKEHIDPKSLQCSKCKKRGVEVIDPKDDLDEIHKLVEMGSSNKKVVVNAEELTETLEDAEDIQPAKLFQVKIALDPEVFQYYSYAVAKGYRGTLSDFINACVKNYMNKVAGVYVVIVEKPQSSVDFGGD